MATKKVEEESKKKKTNSKSTSKKNDTKKKTTSKKGNVEKKVATSKKEVVKEEKNKKDKKVNKEKYEVEEKKTKKIVYNDDEDYEDFEEYDDEDYDDEEEGEVVKVKKQFKDVKEPKKKKKVNVTGDSFVEQNEELFSFLKIIGVVILLVGIVYFIVALINGEFSSDDPEDSEFDIPETIQNEKILGSSIFNKNDEEYYVFAYDTDTDWAEYYSMLYSYYIALDNEDALPLFWVDLNDSMNSGLLATGEEESDKDAQSIGDLRLKSPTLIHIKKGKNVDYWEGEEATEKLKDLIDSYKEKDEDE